MLSLLECYFRDQKKRVVLNGQNLDWKKISSGVPHGSVLGPRLFLTYINDLPEGIVWTCMYQYLSICKIFVDDTSLLSKVINTINSENTLNADLKSISYWAYQYKMQFNPDPKKLRSFFLWNQSFASSSHIQ